MTDRSIEPPGHFEPLIERVGDELIVCGFCDGTGMVALPYRHLCRICLGDGMTVRDEPDR